MITLHHLESSRSLRILWLLEELGVEYEIERYERDKKTSLAPLDLLKIHPLGKAPVISDGDLVVAESGAIIEYLVNKYDNGALRPAGGEVVGITRTSNATGGLGWETGDPPGSEHVAETVC